MAKTKVVLCLEEDEEFRKIIKDMIDGQIKSITRSYIWELFQQEKDRIVENTAKQAVMNVMKDDYFIRKQIKDKIAECLSGFAISDLIKN